MAVHACVVVMIRGGAAAFVLIVQSAELVTSGGENGI